MDFTSISFASLLSMLAMGDSLDNTPKVEPQVAKVSTYTLPSIAGQWQLELTSKDPNQPQCVERYNFVQHQQFYGQSGKELTYGKYLFSDTGNGLPAIAIETQYDNNETDCSGNKIDQTDDMLLAYVKLEKNVMYWCSDYKGQKCEMKLHRIFP